jgi:hypothetical protein
MQLAGASANEVVRGEEPSSAGHGVGPLRAAPGLAGGGVIPELGTADVVGPLGRVVVLVDGELVELEPPRYAPRIERITTMTTMAPARR